MVRDGLEEGIGGTSEEALHIALIFPPQLFRMPKMLICEIKKRAPSSAGATYTP